MDAEVALLRWVVKEGLECVIAAVRDTFEVRLMREGQTVRAKRFKLPAPAFETAHAWRREFMPAAAPEVETFRPLPAR